MNKSTNNSGGTRSKKGRLTTDTILKDVRALKSDALTLTSDARALAKQNVGRFAHTLKEKADETVETVVDKSASVAELTREKIDHGRIVVVEEYDRALEYVRKNPVTSVLVGVVVGAVIGSILRGRGR